MTMILIYKLLKMKKNLPEPKQIDFLCTVCWIIVSMIRQLKYELSSTAVIQYLPFEVFDLFN